MAHSEETKAKIAAGCTGVERFHTLGRRFNEEVSRLRQVLLAPEKTMLQDRAQALQHLRREASTPEELAQVEEAIAHLKARARRSGLRLNFGGGRRPIP
jgi:hypothetical protein